MSYSIYGHISYILEANSKKSITNKKKKKNMNVEEIEWADFFLF